MTIVNADGKGGLYRRDWRGQLQPVGPGDDLPDVHICRRGADFPGGQPPAEAVRDACSRCGVAVARRPAKAAPIVCMQCADIEPLPIE